MLGLVLRGTLLTSGKWLSKKGPCRNNHWLTLILKGWLFSKSDNMITWFQFLWTQALFLRSWTRKCKLFTFSHENTLPTTWEWNNSAKMFCSFSETGETRTCVYQSWLFSLFAEQKCWLQFNFQTTSSIRSQSCPEDCGTICLHQDIVITITMVWVRRDFFYIKNSP